MKYALRYTYGVTNICVNCRNARHCVFLDINYSVYDERLMYTAFLIYYHYGFVSIMAIVDIMLLRKGIKVK